MVFWLDEHCLPSRLSELSLIFFPSPSVLILPAAPSTNNLKYQRQWPPLTTLTLRSSNGSRPSTPASTPRDGSERWTPVLRTPSTSWKVPSSSEAIDDPLVFEIVRHIKDPEHPLSLEQLNVVSLEQVSLQGEQVSVRFTPTIPHCSSASIIGLTILSKLKNSLPAHYKVEVGIEKGTHQHDSRINK